MHILPDALLVLLDATHSNRLRSNINKMAEYFKEVSPDNRCLMIMALFLVSYSNWCSHGVHWGSFSPYRF